MYFMNMHYDTQLKKKVCEDICLNKASTIKTAQEYNIPLKTLEKWITAFNKDRHCFDPKFEATNVPKLVNDFKIVNNFKKSDSSNYDNLSIHELKKELMKKDIEITRLKKGYRVKEGGTEKKVFVILSKKNMK